MPYDATKDAYAQRSTGVNSNARLAAAVTPSDTVDLSPYAKDLYIGVSGDVTVIPINNLDAAPVTFKAVPVGRLGVQVRRVLNTGTAATNILALMD